VILLDTHALVWWLNQDERLSAAAKTGISHETPSGQILVSAISVWEIAMLERASRLQLAYDVKTWIATIRNLNFVNFVPVDEDIALGAVMLPDDFHKDPTDRIIVATARKFGAPIVTADGKIRDYRHVRTIW
jgi:PIN domain nuclease of toxin-antitoxin system